MLKKIIYTIALFFMLTAVAIAGCIVPAGNQAFLATPQGMLKVQAQIDVPVTIDPPDKQPPLSLLQQFSAQAGEDWTDGVAVMDHSGAHLLVHSTSLQCE